MALFQPLNLRAYVILSKLKFLTSSYTCSFDGLSENHKTIEIQGFSKKKKAAFVR